MTDTKDKDWFIKEPFLVPVGTKLTYYSGGEYPAGYEYYVAEEFFSDSFKDVVLKSDILGHPRSPATSPAAYLHQGYDSVTFEIPSEFTVGKTVYNRNNKKFQVASEQAVNKSDEYIYCNIPGEKGVYLIDKDEISSEPIIKGLVFDKIWIDEAAEVDYFPTEPIEDQFEAMINSAFKKMKISTDSSESEHQPNSQGDEEFKPNSDGGIKFDSKKARPTLLLKSMPHAVQEVIDVLELGARKYAPDNWKKVENERYHDAMLRHVLSYLAGENLDPETSKHHLAHAVCNMLFLIEKEGTVVPDVKEKEDLYAQRNQD